MHYIYASLRTPDGTLLESRPGHMSFVSHTDANGIFYFLDLGASYYRTSHPDLVSIITSEDPHSTIREYVQWGTYGKDGTDPLRYILLRDLEDGHLYTLVTSYLDHNHRLYNHFLNELNYRAGTHEDLSQ